jgi:protein-tyrosine phosphatase
VGDPQAPNGTHAPNGTPAPQPTAARDGTPAPGAPRARVLVVCRANVARSPLAAALLADALAGTGIEVASAGVQAIHGAPPARGTVELAQRRGLDVTGHGSRPVTAELMAGAALVVTMSEAHRDICTRLTPVSSRTFTLRELDRLATAAEAPPGTAPAAHHGAAHDTPPERLHRLVEAAHLARPWATPPSEPEDIADPMGRDWGEWFALADELEWLLARLAARVLHGPHAG